MLSSYIERPKNIRFESQGQQEILYYLLRKHPITNLGWILMSLLMVFLPVFFMYSFSRLGINTFNYVEADIQALFLILWYLVTMFFTFEAFLTWYFNVYIITDKRLIDIDFRGLWNKRVSETSLAQIEDATYETSKFLHILFDYGNISVQTAAEKGEFEFHSIPKPGIVHDKFTDLVEDFKKQHGTN